WWEFHYPEYGIRTANELYLPIGRTVNFALRTQDVIHSFWIPQLGGKRDLISNRTNYVWFTPDSTMESSAWNGFCAEFCGVSHANMKFRTFTVQPAEFERWVAHQQSPAAFGAVAPAAPATAPATSPAAVPAAGAGQGGAGDPAQGQAVELAVAADSAAPASAGEPYWFPVEQLPEHILPQLQPPASVTVNESLVGDPQRG